MTEQKPILSHLKKLIVIAAVSLGLFYVIAINGEWLRRLPGFHCESFGCTGLGILYLIIIAATPPIFGLAGGFFAKKGQKLHHGLFAFGMACIVMLAVLIIIFASNQFKIAQAYKEQEDICRQYQLCL